MTRYALLDPANFMSPLTWLRERDLPAVPLLPLDSAPGITRVTPWLTQPDAGAEGELLLHQSLDWGLWIEADIALGELANLMANRRVVQAADDTIMMLRWWDARLLRSLWPVLSLEQRAWLLRGLERIGIPAPGAPVWLQAPAVLPAPNLVMTPLILVALSDGMAADRIGPITEWIAGRWPDLAAEEQQELAVVTVAQARRLGLEEPRDWLSLAQLLALLGSGFLDDPLYTPLVEELFLKVDRRRLIRNEGGLLSLANARLSEGAQLLGILRLVLDRDELAARYAVLPDATLVRQVYGVAAAAFPAEAITAAREASKAALLIDDPTADANDCLRFSFLRLLLGAGFQSDPLRQLAAQAYRGGGLAGVAAWVAGIKSQVGGA